MVNTYNRLEHLDIDFVPDVKISHPEVHLLEVMLDNPYKKVSQLAEIYGVTKGAVSQQIKKLEKRDLIRRVKHNDNCKEVFIELTEVAKQAVAKHRELEVTVLENLGLIFSDITPEQATFVSQIMKSITEGIEKVEEEFKV